MTQGDSFGDIALAQEVPRTATVIAESDCLLLRLSKADYVDVLKSSQQRDKSDKLAMLLRVFPGMQRLLETISFERLVYSVRVRSSKAGSDFRPG